MRSLLALVLTPVITAIPLPGLLAIFSRSQAMMKLVER
jgi:hypothetical protein